MRRATTAQHGALGLTAAVLLLGTLAARVRDAAVPISGEAELTYSKRDAVPVSGAENHILAIGSTKGVNKNTGSGDYFADAQVANVEVADLNQGNGTHQGYYTATKGSDAMTAKWHGKVTTVMGRDKKPRTSFKGTWSYVQGAGRYQNLKGNGTYEGEFLAEDRYVVRWKGERTSK